MSVMLKRSEHKLMECPYGCCSEVFGRKAETRRVLRRRERAAWMKEVWV